MADSMSRGEDSTIVDAGVPPEAPPPKEIEFLPTNFTIDLETRLRGMAGLPAYLLRARHLEATIDEFWEEVARLHEVMRNHYTRPSEFAREWRAAVARMDFSKVDGVVADYNEYFPIEANLPMDPHLQDFVYRGAKFTRMVAPTREDVLERFPAEPTR